MNYKKSINTISCSKEISIIIFYNNPNVYNSSPVKIKYKKKSIKLYYPIPFLELACLNNIKELHSKIKILDSVMLDSNISIISAPLATSISSKANSYDFHLQEVESGTGPNKL